MCQGSLSGSETLKSALGMRQYARIVDDWIEQIGLDSTPMACIRCPDHTDAELPTD